MLFVNLLQDGLAVNADAPINTPGKEKEKKKEGKSSAKKSRGGKDADNGNGDANAADNHESNHDGPKSPPVVCVHIIGVVFISCHFHLGVFSLYLPSAQKNFLQV